MADGRKYDIILYGASGFTGRQTVEYCRRNAPPGLKWAIAGRDRAKLEALHADTDILTANGSDVRALDSLAEQTRVVATTAGPFSAYGSELVAACVRQKTHYCDITGETPWIRGLIDRHHAQAAADGTRIIPCCGFDSIPSDVGSWLMARHIREAWGSEAERIAAYFRVEGGVNGGTLATAFALSASGEVARTRELYLLDPDPAAHSDEEQVRNADPVGARFDSDIGAWVTPFLMGAINTRIVRRTQALMGRPFDYQEYSRFNDATTARVVAGGGRVFEWLLGSGLGRRLMKPLLPKPGEGPSEQTMDSGFFECTFVGVAQSGAKVQAVMKGQGDPGNRITVKCLCESAFVLALGSEGLAGVVTPVSGMGDALVARLNAAGISFTATE